MALTAEQRRTVDRVLRTGAKHHTGKRKVDKTLDKAAILTIRTEANYEDVPHGDRDSEGAFQQRPSQGWGPASETLEQDANQFYAAAKRAYRPGMSSAQLAQAVQRSAFPGRFAAGHKEAEALLRSRGARRRDPGGGGSRTRLVKVTRTIPGVDRSDQRQEALLAYLDERWKPDSLLNLADALRAARNTPPRKVTTTKRVSGGNTRTPARRLGGGGSGETDIESVLRLARKMGLTVREHPAFDRVDPVHTKGSWHYRRARRSRGAAGDVSGNPRDMARFAKLVKQRYGSDLEELIYRGPGAGLNVKNGRRVGKNFYSGHRDHVHVADDD